MYDRNAHCQAWVLALALSLIFLGACVPAYETRLTSMREEGDLAAADRLLAGAEARDPENPDILRERGIVALERGDPVAAIPLLERALSLAPDDARAALYLGAAYELDRRWSQAEARYLMAENLGIGSPELEGELGCRRQSVELRRLSEEVAERLDDERAGALQPGQRILVLPFAVNTENEVALSIRLGLASLLASDLVEEPMHEAVSFTEVLAFLDALDVSIDAEIDSSLEERLARLTGARFVVTGQISELHDVVSVAPVVVDRALADSGGEQRLEYLQSRVGTLLELEKQLLVRVARAIDIELAPHGDEALRIFSSRSGLAVRLYGDALRLVERGDREAAVEHLERALGLDPEFREARDAYRQISLCRESSGAPDHLLAQYERERTAAEAAARQEVLLAETTNDASRIGGPEGEGNDLSLNRAGGASGTVAIPVRLPR
jgi:tetratricopeptide (TPR) repeat protein